VSFLENENQMVIDAEYSYIGEQLVEDWVNSNLDEGQLFADLASNQQAMPFFESLYGLKLECLRTADDAFVVSPVSKRRQEACTR
jgi:hypothetical protein